MLDDGTRIRKNDESSTRNSRRPLQTTIMAEDQLLKTKTKNWATAGIIISWTTFWMFLLLPFGLIAWIAILVYLIIKKANLSKYIIFSAWLFVPSCTFIKETVHYFTGAAALRSIGGPTTYHGIDRETRVPLRSSGCIVIGYEPFVFQANNFAVNLWTSSFGFQKGSYTGAFPTEEEAREIINSADTISVNHVGKLLQFDTKKQIIEVDTTSFYIHLSSSKELNLAVGKTIKDECFIFKRLTDNKQEASKEIYIVDINNKRLLTTYY